MPHNIPIHVPGPARDIFTGENAMDTMLEALNRGAAEYNIPLSEQQAALLCRFGSALLEKNRVMNLTAITEPDQVALLHFVDSLLLLKEADFRGRRVIDVGCGGGFPGVPIKIGCPETELTLLDSLGKRMRWLSEILPELGVEAECITARAEEEALRRRERYDFAVSRAVARLNVLSELCLPYVKVGGLFLAMKGAAGREEAREAARGIEALGGRIERLQEYSLEGAARIIVAVRKERPTPRPYPRSFAKIKQKPL